MITYAVLVLISAVVIIFSGISIFTEMVTETSESLLSSHNTGEMFVEVIDLLADLRQAEKYEPENMLKQDYIDDIADHMKLNAGGVVVKFEDQVIRSKQLNMTEASIEALEPDHSQRRHDNYIKTETEEYFFIDYSFDVNGKTAVYFFVVDVSSLSDVRLNVGRQSFTAFIIVLMIVTLPVLYIITKDIIGPLRQLSIGVDHIKEGDLSFELHSKKNNEIGAVIKSFETMRQRLKISIERQIKFEDNRKELITSISHDLKTPITSIKGHVEGIRDGVANSPEKLDKYLDVIYQKSHDMDQLINDLFLFSKLDLKKVPFDFKRLPIKEFVAEIVQEMAFDFNESGESVTLEDHVKTDEYVSLDPIQMKRVLVNIMQNSMKYMDKDEKRVTVVLNETPKTIQIVIADNGMGIQEEHLDNIFDRFYRVDESRNPETGGTGLGLAISKQIVQGHGGKINAFSKFGEGTQMVIELKKEVKND